MDIETTSSNFGSIPTPRDVVVLLVDFLINHWKKNSNYEHNKEILILDNSVGDGRFLVEILSAFKNLTIQNKSETLSTLLYGVDIDPLAIEKAKIKILNELIKTKIKLRVGNTLLGYIFSPNFGKRISTRKHLSSLYCKELDIDIKSTQLTFFHWFLEWPEVEINEGFDICLGNPPFGLNFSLEEKSIFKKFYKAIDIEFESYLLFLERSINLTRNRGLIGLILPSNIATNFNYKPAREYLLKNVRILNFITFNKNFFPKIHIEPCILILQKINSEIERNNSQISFEKYKLNRNKQYIPISKQLIQQKEIHNNPYLFLQIPSKIEIIEILNKIEKNTAPLEHYVKITRGIELGFNSKVSSDKRIDDTYVPLIAGRTLQQFRIGDNIRFIKFDSSNKSIFKSKELYLTPQKLLIRRIGHNLVAALDTNQFFCVCDVYILILKHNFVSSDIFCLEGVLNSSLMRFYLKYRLASIKTIFPKIPIKFLKELPIKIDFCSIQLEKIVKEIHKIAWNLDNFAQTRKKLVYELNEEIFSIYGISEEEKAIINEDRK